MKKLTQLLKESQHLDYRRMNVGEEDGQGMTKEEKRAFVEAVAAYRQLGEMISHKGNLSEIHESIKGIVENANNITLKETGDWFDRVTVQRHMKSMNESFKVFSNTIKEVSTLQQRLESSYDEIGEVLGKYYEIKEGNEFGAERAKAIAAGEDSFEVDGKSYKVTGVDAEDKKNAEEFANESMKLTSLIKRNEELTGNQHKLDIDGDGEIEASDLAALRAGKKADESVNEATLKQGTMLRYDKNNFVVDYVVDKKYTGKDGFDKYILKVVKSNFPNKIKVGSTEEYEDSKLTGLIRNKVMNFVKNESVNDLEEVTANTSKLFNWFWQFSSAKDIAKRVSQLNDKDLLSLYDEAEDLKRNGRLRNPRQIQLALLKKEIDRRGLSESVNEEEIKWNAVENAIINFLKANTKILDKRVQAKDTEGVKGGLSSIIRGLTNAQRSLKLESVNEIKKGSVVIPYAMDKHGEFIVDKVFKNKSGETSYTGKFKKSGESKEFILHSKDKVVKESVNTSVNEITLARGLKDLIKGTTSSVEGIKVSKELASAIASWTTSSTYGQRYGNQMLKSPFANVWKMVFSPSFGIEAHLKRYDKEALNTLKPELMKIKSKLGM